MKYSEKRREFAERLNVGVLTEESAVSEETFRPAAKERTENFSEPKGNAYTDETVGIGKSADKTLELF